MKTYDFGSSHIIQNALRNYVNFGAIPLLDEFLQELEKELSELERFRKLLVLCDCGAFKDEQ